MITVETLAAEVRAAEARIRPFIRETPLLEAPVIGELGGGRALLKLETLQHTGSFKARGALSALTALPHAQRARGVVAASSGNHGAAVAYGARALGVPALVFVPEGASPVKLAAMRRMGAEVLAHGTDSLESELRARAHAAERGMAYVSPYNDALVVAGQGTLGLEIARQTDHLDALIVAVGGGGLAAGAAAALRERWPGLLVVGAQPAASAVMAESVRAGEIVDILSTPTLSDGTAGGIEAGAITFDYCRALVDEYVLASEAEIAAAMRLLLESEHMLAEGAAALAVAVYLKLAPRLAGKIAAIILCGANVSAATVGRVLSSQF